MVFLSNTNDLSKKALTSILLAVMVPVIGYLLMKRASDHSIGMPGRYYYDSVKTVIRDGKSIDDTVWHSVMILNFKTSWVKPCPWLICQAR